MAIKTPMAYPPPSSGQSRHLAWSGHSVVATWLLYSYAVIAIKHAWVKDGRLHIVGVSHIRLSKKFKLRKARIARPLSSQSWTIRRIWCQRGEDAWCQQGEGKNLTERWDKSAFQTVECCASVMIFTVMCQLWLKSCRATDEESKSGRMVCKKEWHRRVRCKIVGKKE